MASLRHQLPFEMYFDFLFHGRHLSFRCRLMSDNVSSVIFGSGMIENVRVAVGIASPSVSVQKLFPLPVSWPTFEFPMSANVGSVIFGSGMVENVGVAIGIASPSVSVQTLFPLPVSWPTFEFPMSADVGQCRPCHIRIGHVRKCGGSRWNCFATCFRSVVKVS